MSYRIRYEVQPQMGWRWSLAGVVFGMTIVLALQLSNMAAGEGVYDALARYVGGMILGPC